METNQYLKHTAINESVYNGYAADDIGWGYEAVYLYSTAVFTMLTNFLLVVTLLCKTRFRRPANYLLLHLCFWCSTTVTISIFRYIMQRQAMNLLWLQMTSNFSCRFWAFAQRMCVAAMTLSTMALSNQRVKTIRNPIVRQSQKDYIKKMICITSYSILVTIPVIFTKSYDKRLPPQYKCRKMTIGNSVMVTALYGVWQFCTTTLLPAITLMYEHWRTRYQIKYLLTKEGRRVLKEDRSQLLFLTSCIYSIIFVVCCVPYGILLSLKDLRKDIFPTFDLQQKIVRYYKGTRNLVILHTGINPLLFIFLNYQWTFKGLFKTLTSSN